MTHHLSIGALAERTGTTPNVLRTWEHRFGFPAGRRTASGHRRFSEHDVQLVTEVLAAKERGVPLHLAVASVAQRSRLEQSDSVHGALIRDFPDLRPARLSRATLIAASHAIEDECLARGDRPLVLGTFQEGHQYAGSQPRWEELGRTATWAAVLADFSTGPAADLSARPARCQLAEDSPLRREWTVAAVSGSFAAALAAWEVPGAGPRPTYEAVITLRRAPALAAARVLMSAVRQAGATAPAAAEELLAATGTGTAADGTSGADADRLLLRMLERADEHHRR